MKNPFERNRGILRRIAGHARLRQGTTNIYAQEFVPTKKSKEVEMTFQNRKDRK